MFEQNLRDQFPIFSQPAKSLPWVYFDSAATSQKPAVVLETIQSFYAKNNVNVHRGSHSVGLATTQAFEQARQTIQHFINAASHKEIIWTKGSTDSINLLAAILAKGQLKAGDEIVISSLEHHANIVPWQQVAAQLGLHIKVLPISKSGVLDLEQSLALIGEKTALLAVAHVSNALGNIQPIRQLIHKAKSCGALTLIDGAQAVGHLKIDVQALDCDFYAFSGHKMFGPTGIGVLYGKQALLENLPPYQTGGEMVKTVSFTTSTFQDLPLKFEAGTPNIAGVLGIATAAEFIQQQRANIAKIETTLYQQLITGLEQIPELRLWGEINNSISLQSFTVDGIDNQDLGMLLNEQNFAVRVGHHCAMPLMHCLGLSGTLRVSLACYNTSAEIQRFLQALNSALNTLRTTNSAVSIEMSDKAITGQPLMHSPIAGRILQSKGWDETYRQIMLAGKGLNRLPIDQRQGEYEVFGCESQVWLKCDVVEDRVILLADSGSKIVRGLLAIVFEPIEHMRVEELAGFDLQAYLAALGLSKHLSQSRGNGLRAVMETIMAKCESALQETKKR
jgi:cysteine desulfurase/selenocysteine lyase